MSRAMSLHIGVWSPEQCDDLGELSGPKADAFAMAAIACHHGFESHVLTGSKATPEALEARINCVKEHLDPDGTFLLTFSGHGTQSPNGIIQTWCMATRKVTDDELFEKLAVLPETTRVIIVSASCHSGGIGGRFWKHIRQALEWLTGLVARDWHTRSESQPSVRPDPVPVTRPSVLVLASCAANQPSEDGTPLSVFTEVLWRTWDYGGFAGNNKEFLSAIELEFLGKNQTPTSRQYGAAYDWDSARPFQK